MDILSKLLLAGLAFSLVAGSAHAANLHIKKNGGKHIKPFTGTGGNAARGATCPAPGRAIEACGGAGNAAVAWDEDEEGNTHNRRFFCAEF
ncbi:MAG: hypothetical protein CML29_14475 [Rhizobiales bacterium]|nr:hypothetical protein [Hyphomicrobiales bacterium]MBA68708.1 hypothetical protein [Hyphomicrobiales bacterium]|tara:strand:- start:977 stop:1249 length:273 start_codon:yes stop_codon:yes gene_type:complete